MKLLMFVTLFVFGSIASAGEVGNGGDVLVCENKKDVILLDYFEHEEIRGKKIDVIGNTWQEKVHFIINRVEKLDPLRAQFYRTWLNEFTDQSLFMANAELIDVPDSMHVVLPKGCKIQQLAIQNIPKFKTDKRYIFNRDLWLKMDSTHQAGAVMHEFIYREAIEAGQTNSVGTRYLNSLYATRGTENLSQEIYRDILVKAGVNWIGYFQHKFSLDSDAKVTYYENSTSVRSATKAIVHLPSGEYRQSETATFFQDGSLKGFTSYDPVTFHAKLPGSTQEVLAMAVNNNHYTIYFNQNGEMVAGNILSSGQHRVGNVRLNLDVTIDDQNQYYGGVTFSGDTECPHFSSMNKPIQGLLEWKSWELPFDFWLVCNRDKKELTLSLITPLLFDSRASGKFFAKSFKTFPDGLLGIGTHDKNIEFKCHQKNKDTKTIKVIKKYDFQGASLTVDTAGNVRSYFISYGKHDDVSGRCESP